jgi:ribosomal 50S subunit-associated protein YjgA (DUF615 family)
MGKHDDDLLVIKSSPTSQKRTIDLNKLGENMVSLDPNPVGGL